MFAHIPTRQGHEVPRGPRRSKHEFSFTLSEAPPGATAFGLAQFAEAHLHACVVDYLVNNPRRTNPAATVHTDTGRRLLLARRGVHWAGCIFTDCVWVYVSPAGAQSLDYHATPRDEEVARFAHLRAAAYVAYRTEFDAPSTVREGPKRLYCRRDGEGRAMTSTAHNAAAAPAGQHEPMPANDAAPQRIDDAKFNDDGNAFYRDATLLGPIARGLLDKQLTIAGGNGRDEIDWQNTPTTVRLLLDRLCRFTRGEKDGPAILAGELIAKGRRQLPRMKAQHLLVLDVDDGTTIEEVRDALAARPGLFCALYNSHSHWRTSTFLAESAILEHLGRERPEAGKAPLPALTSSDAVQYLVEGKGNLARTFQGAVLGERQLMPGTRKNPRYGYKLTHEPWAKVRVVFLLTEPYEFGTAGEEHTKRLDQWKATVRSLAHELGLNADKSCFEASKLFYLPRVAHGVVTAAEGDDLNLHDIVVNPGDALDLKSVAIVQEPEKAAKPKKERAAGASGTAGEPDAEFLTPGLRRFLERCGSSFAAADFFNDTAPDDIRHEYPGGQKVDATCPWEHLHTEGDDNDRAFYASSSSDAASWNMHCAHASCIARAKGSNGKHDRARLLDAACRAYGITDAGQLTEWCDDAAKERWRKLDAFSEVPPGAGVAQPGEPAASGQQQPRKLLEYPSELSRKESMERRAKALVRGVLMPGDDAVLYATPGAGKT